MSGLAQLMPRARVGGASPSLALSGVLNFRNRLHYPELFDALTHPGVTNVHHCIVVLREKLERQYRSTDLAGDDPALGFLSSISNQEFFVTITNPCIYNAGEVAHLFLARPGPGFAEFNCKRPQRKLASFSPSAWR
jgi:hypothetical protein